MAPTLTPDRQTFRALVADVAAKAKEKLPLAVNGRVESAAKLVLWQDVEPQDDGSILVGSASDPGKQYRLVGHTCTCQDFTRGQAPEGWCQHRIAAGIHKRVQQLLAAEAPAAPVVPEVLPEPFPDNDPEDAPAAGPPVPPASALCPEALFSLTLKGRLDGIETLLTVRGMTAAEFQANLAAVRGLLEVPTPSQPRQSGPQVSGQGQGWCPVHHVSMKQTQKDGRSWWSHRTDQAWGKGREPKGGSALTARRSSWDRAH